MADANTLKAHCRTIEDADLSSVVECLARHFPERARAYWRQGLAAMGRRAPVADCPRYGYLIDAEGATVGVLLQFSSTREEANGSCLRSNLSSLCVDQPFRGLAYALQRRALASKQTTYLNISPAPHTRKMIEVLGFRPFSDGQLFFAPLLSRRVRDARIVEFAEDRPEAAWLRPEERRLLADHSAFGCRALIGVKEGAATPIVLQWRTVWRSIVPGAHVLYCPSEAELAVFARALGLYCARHGRLFLVVDATGPVAGLVGKFFAGREPRYFKGPRKPPPNDLAYTELAILGR